MMPSCVGPVTTVVQTCRACPLRLEPKRPREHHDEADINRRQSWSTEIYGSSPRAILLACHSFFSVARETRYISVETGGPALRSMS